MLEIAKTPFETPAFDKITNEHFLPAFEASIAEAKAEVDAIVNSKKKPDFENTIAALDRTGDRLDQISSIFFNLLSAETDAQKQTLAQTISPMLTEFSNDINLNDRLFKRVKQVYEVKDKLKLTPEQSRLLEKTYKGFVRGGANLSDEDKLTYREVSKELSTLTLTFNNNVLAETNAFVLHITDQSDLAGLPASVIESAEQTAKAKKLEGWCFTLQAPSYMPFMKYAENRALREKLYRAYNTRGTQDNEFNNQQIIQKIVSLRLKLVNLLGYKTYADYVLEERMATNTEQVNKLLNQLLDASKPVAMAELAEIQAFANRKGVTFTLQPWDWSFYSEKLKDEKYSINEELLRPYFQLEKVREGIFDLTQKLYGISFKENKSIPLYHPEVQTYEVYDEKGQFLSVLYLDFYPREGKRPGAWMTSYRSQKKIGKTDVRPFISIVCNFTRPTDDKPSLLTFNEFETFMHEFGHALHGMLSDCTYSSLSGTSVYRDFVELPSQIMENWCVEKEFLDLFAEHYQTGEKIPADLIQKIIASQNFLSGYASMRQLSFGMLDMAYHSQTVALTESIPSFEKKAIESTNVLTPVEGCLVSTAFAHIFAGGYAAGYYSYKWAEVLDADAFSVFKEKGIFDRQTAEKFRATILSKGGTEHPMELYKRFRGQEPTIDALFIRSGFKPNL